MDTFWSFGSLELDQFVERKKFLGYKFLETRIWKQRAETGESENFAFQGQWNRSDHCDLGRTKNLSFMVKAFYLQSSGRTNNC